MYSKYHFQFSLEGVKYVIFYTLWILDSKCIWYVGMEVSIRTSIKKCKMWNEYLKIYSCDIFWHARLTFWTQISKVAFLSSSQLGKSLARFALAPLFIRLNDVNNTAICNLFSINFKGKLLSRHKYIIGMHIAYGYFGKFQSFRKFYRIQLWTGWNWKLKKYGTYS